MRCAGARWRPAAVAQFEFLLIAAAVAEGWAVSVPDHEGRKGMWGAPYEPGYHVLDGLRAALSTERLGLSPTAPIGLWGYSGGGLASAWAAEMCGSYAPELNIVGAVLGSPVGDLGHTFRRLNGTYMSGLPALVVAALADIYPELNKVIQEHATDEGKDAAAAAAQHDHRGSGHPDGQEGHGRHARRSRWSRSSTPPRCSTFSTTSSSARRCPRPRC